MKDKTKIIIRYFISNIIYTAVIFIIWLIVHAEYLRYIGFRYIIISWDYVIISYSLLVVVLTIIDMINYYIKNRTKNAKK